MPPPLPDLPEGPSLEDLRGPVEIPLLEPWQFWALLLCGAALAGLILWILVRWIRNRRVPEAPINARDAALSALALAGGRGDCREFAAIVSGALRGYCAEALGIRALEQTSAELLSAAKGHADIPAEDLEPLEWCLHRCDNAKFARRDIPETERGQLTQTATAWIEAHWQRTHEDSNEAHSRTAE